MLQTKRTYTSTAAYCFVVDRSNPSEEKGFEPDFFAGHSLGELAAWAFAGAMTPEDAVEITAVRGQSHGAGAARYAMKAICSR